MVMVGLALIRLGREDEGFVEARRGIKQVIASNAFMNGPFILYAEACQEAGRVAEGMEILEYARAASIAARPGWRRSTTVSARGSS
jgi:hypothetical protein